MIPKIIHLCWLSGDPYPPEIQKCLDTWKVHLPDYEVWLWDTRRFDVSSTLWTRQAFEAKKYAFAADYIRLYALYNYGGIYLDSDVLVYKSFNPLLHLPYFIGCDQIGAFEAAVIGAEKGCPWVKDILDTYEGRPFRQPDGTMDMLTLPCRFHDVLTGKGYRFLKVDEAEGFDLQSADIHNKEMYVFAADYFNGRDEVEVHPTARTFCAHNYMGSWQEMGGVSPKAASRNACSLSFSTSATGLGRETNTDGSRYPSAAGEIPHVIHYCWFGRNPLPEAARKCIASWRKFLPGYEIREWNEDNFDVNIIPYTAEAYALKKYAFVSDYARFWILYRYGGIYFDTDVEVIRPLDDIIAQGPFMGFETDPKPLPGDRRSGGMGAESDDAAGTAVAPGLGLGVNPGLGLMKELLGCYEGRHFVYEDNTRNQITVVHITTELLLRHGLQNRPGIQQVAGVSVYPSEYFCPVNVTTGRLHVTPKTRTIHHYAGTWAHPESPLKAWLKRFLPERMVVKLVEWKAARKRKTRN